MKKLSSQFRPSLAFFAALFLVVALFVPVFAAGPTQPAPNGNNVNAVFNSVAAGELNIAANGDISNSAAGTVHVNNAAGLEVDATGDRGIDVRSDADWGTAGTFWATGGAGFNAGVHGVALNGAGGAFNGSAYGVSAVITDPINGKAAGSFANKEKLPPTAYVNLATPTKAIDALGNVTVQGHISSDNGIGAYSLVTQTSGPIALNKVGIITAMCPLGSVVVDCGFKNAGNNKSYLTNSYIIPGNPMLKTQDTCQITVYNNDVANLNYTGQARCFNPNG